MSRVIIFSTIFPKYHIKHGEPTCFVDAILAGLSNKTINDFEQLKYNRKFHTIRAGNRWKVGDVFSPRIWSGKPYCSKQIIIHSDITIEKVWDIKLWINKYGDRWCMFNGNDRYTVNIETNLGRDLFKRIASYDGLKLYDLFEWFKFTKNKNSKFDGFSGQIICWNKNVKYLTND